MGFTNAWEDLGMQEFVDEKVKKRSKEQLKEIRKVVHAEVLETSQGQGSRV